ncbi:Non-motile and phage-resistance protein [Devosia equisanguinis]|uniref:histidine kinase n=1 Tax=Devosia equisanguinis TaxID=2490941 RepID=A0A447ICN4_9HYPH|nr:PAS domain-containing sensor histidine kinase [Devosia equisanguinis]VDS05237.1 Non-motile and phage-resistance protein [Devosia equisanguinis]
MRSTEMSGAGASGFCAKDSTRTKRVSSSVSVLPAWRQVLSPVTLAVAATAFLSAGLFVAYDIYHTLDVARRQAAPVATMMAAAAISQRPTTQMARSLVAQSFLPLDATQPEPKTLLTQASFAMAPVADSLPVQKQTTHVEATPAGDVLSGLFGRGAAAFGLAGLFTLVAARRRPGDDMPNTMQRFNYSQLAAAIPMGLACWTREGRLIVCNDSYRNRLELDEDGTSYHQAVSRLAAGGYMKLVREDDSNRILELHRQDGSCLMIDERPLGDGCFMTLVSDVTEHKRTSAMLDSIRVEQRQLARRYHEEKLKAEAASRAKTNFLAHLSHDIRTPLNHIIGFAELMKHETYGPLGDARYRDYVQSIKASGEHLLASFGTILDLAELDSGQKALRQDAVPVDEVIDSVAKRFKGQMHRAGIRLIIGKSCGAVLRGDRLGMVRMLGNIVENSIRFTERGGHVRLAAFAADDGVVIEISDTGIGMSEERLASLSQPFALGDATFTREGVGPGLGISIARAIAEQSGGHMVIDSAPSLGTTVAISLPIETAMSEMAA